MKKRILALLLVAVMVIAMFPTLACAAETEEEQYVYISVSKDGKYLTGTSDRILAYVPVAMSELEKIDLETYGMGSYVYDADGDSKNDITVLHLFIYAQEKLYGGKWSDVQASGYPGSLFFSGGLFGFDANMIYYHNGRPHCLKSRRLCRCGRLFGLEFLL